MGKTEVLLDGNWTNICLGESSDLVHAFGQSKYKNRVAIELRLSILRSLLDAIKWNVIRQ